MRQLLVEITSQSVELFDLTKIFGRNRFIEFDRESTIVRPARLIGAKMARALGLARSLRIAHVGIVGHVCSRRFRRFGGGVRHVLGGQLRVLHAHSLHLVRVGGLALLPGLLLAAVFLAFVFVLFRIVAAIL